MIAFVITNALDLGLWTLYKIYNGTYYMLYGPYEDVEKKALRQELKMLHDKLDALISSQNKITN